MELADVSAVPSDSITRYSDRDYMIGNTNKGILRKIFRRLNHDPTPSFNVIHTTPGELNSELPEKCDGNIDEDLRTKRDEVDQYYAQALLGIHSDENEPPYELEGSEPVYELDGSHTIHSNLSSSIRLSNNQNLSSSPGSYHDDLSGQFYLNMIDDHLRTSFPNSLGFSSFMPKENIPRVTSPNN